MKVSAELFHLAYEAVSTEMTRYYLGGVFVQKHPEQGAYLVSTDGHRMVVVHDATAEVDGEAIVSLPKFVLQQLPRRKGFSLDKKSLVIDTESRTATVIIETEDRDGVVIRTEKVVTAHGVIIDGAFPDWKRVVPKGEMESPGQVRGFNGAYLAKFGSFSKKVGGPMYLIAPKDGTRDSPVIIRWGTVDHVFGILMPMRTDVEYGLPVFMAE